MHDVNCECECCREYTAQEQEAAIEKLFQALEKTGGDGSISADERRDLDLAEVVKVDAGMRHPVPAIMFHPPGRLQKLKAGFTYDYLLETQPAVIASSILSRMRKHLSG
jgi:hypothetical protein